MKPKPYLVVLCLNCLLCVCVAVNPAAQVCIAYESVYHIERACECVVYQSYGGTQGIFMSPNFPEIYPPGVNCLLYTFIAELDEIIELSFLNFDLQVPIINKCTDFLKFFLDLERPEVNERYSWNYELCGNLSMVQKKHYSSDRSLILEFHTDSIQANNTGFKGIFKFLDKAQFQIEGGSIQWGSKCSYNFESNKQTKSGKFFSHKYPQNYPPNSNCQYVFEGEPNEVVRVTFQNIQLENIDGSCTDSPDTIVVRDGKDSQATVISNFCNTRNNEIVTSTSNYLYIEFISDGKQQRQGFAATFEFMTITKTKPDKGGGGGGWGSGGGGRGGGTTPTKNSSINSGVDVESPGDSPIHSAHPKVTTPTAAVPTDCEYSFMSTSRKNGTFTSRGYPRPYQGPVTCRYTFEGSGRERVQIFFTTMDLNYPAGDPNTPHDCEEVDTVVVKAPVRGHLKEMGVYCGRKLPPMLMSNGNRMEVTFTSYSSSAAKGFNGTYKFVTDFGIHSGQQKTDLVCGFVYNSSVSPNGTFTSPNFPGLYPRETECHYLFMGTKYEKVHIIFPYFEVEGITPGCTEDTLSDYVEFSNFDINYVDRKMKRSCGSDKDRLYSEGIMSDASFFRVTFKSNVIYDARGFEAFYQFRKHEDPKISHNQSNGGSSSVFERTSFFQCRPFLLLATLLPCFIWFS